MPVDLRNWGKGRPETPPTIPAQKRPSREEFEAAAAKAPAGLSEEDFYAFIDKELAPKARADELPDMMAVRAPITEGGQPITPEPDTFWGGFTKHITDSLIRNPAIQGAAHPTSLGDILSLVIPSGAPNMRTAASNVGREIGAGASEAPRLRNVPGSILKRISQYWQETPAQTSNRRLNDLPLWKQQELLDNAPQAAAEVGPIRSQEPLRPSGGETLAERAAKPRTPKPAPAPAPKPEKVSVGGQNISPEDQLYKKLMEMANEDAATSASSGLRSGSNLPGTMTPTERTVSEVPGAVGASDPFTEGATDYRVDTTELDPRITSDTTLSLPVSDPKAPVKSGEDAILEELMGKFGGTQQAPAADFPPRILSLKPDKMSPQDWLDARRYYGSRKLAQLTGLPEEEVVRLAPGPSRTPLEVEERATGDSRVMSHLPREE